MRPVLMTSLAAAIGLLPAAIASGIGAQSQQPLARVVVGGMLTSAALILFVLPVLYQLCIDSMANHLRRGRHSKDWMA